ncbi:MAG: peptide chain release factor N(5)-glutamine methyltransferase [Deltaproteobacteria bacterium]|jgi:release factor glutamine methyltransferase|nr:peptide chain release factor N(5)-glutamine methyltransferase [Deltaproteobacteria bacterium]
MPEKIWTVANILATTADFLGKKDQSCPRLEAELLLSKVLDLKRVQLYINFERVLTEAELTSYRQLVLRRRSFEPVAYILGQKEFYGLELTVTSDTLIPRPETEHLVDEALRLLKQGACDAPKTADIGCGSGAIAIALAKNNAQVSVEAVDISAEALKIAEKNAHAHQLTDRITFRLGDLAKPLAGMSFDLICANLPYIPDAALKTLAPTVANYEPLLALAGGPEGIDLISRLLKTAPELLKPGGYILLEIWPDSLGLVTASAKAAGLKPLEPVLDYSKKNRIFVAQASNTTK